MALFHVLGIDDSLTIRKLLEMVFTRAGYSFELAATGEEGITRARRTPPSSQSLGDPVSSRFRFEGAKFWRIWISTLIVKPRFRGRSRRWGQGARKAQHGFRQGFRRLAPWESWNLRTEPLARGCRLASRGGGSFLPS